MATIYDSRIAKQTRRLQTCDVCKARHQMCDGAMPKCSNCQLRFLHCTYSIAQAKGSDRKPPVTKPPKSSSVLLNTSRSGLAISDAQYASLRDQLLDDILRGVYSKSIDPLAREVTSPDDMNKYNAQSRVSSASLPSLHQQISDLINNSGSSNLPWDLSRAGSQSYSSTERLTESPLRLKTDHARKILKESLPARKTSRHLLGVFMDYQNSIFYVCNRDEAQEQLDLMYEDVEQVSLAWFCQMFLIFAVGIQFDDADEDDSSGYYELGRKYMDDALDENPENNIWVVRAMLLICFYQPPAKWTTLWIYLDTAIRKAQSYQLDLGQNSSETLGDTDYQEWRQVWLTLISFDRWVAIFLGRLPHIKESISRDPIFKNIHFQQGPGHCVIQNSIAGLAIIMGFILRGMYLPEQTDYTKFQKYQNELEKLSRGLPDPLRDQIESGIIENMVLDQHEATFTLHFLYLGAWMFLTKPMLLDDVKEGATNYATRSAISPLAIPSSNNRICVQYALRVVTSSTTMLYVPRSSKRMFIPLYFLVYAAHILILQIFNRMMVQSDEGYFPGISPPQAIETEGLDAAIRVLDFCSQRHTFARKYSHLIKQLRSQMEVRSSMSPPGAPSTESPLNAGMTTEDISFLGKLVNDEPAKLTGLGSYSHYVPEAFSADQNGTNEFLPGIEPGQYSQSAENMVGMGFDLSWLGESETSSFTGDP